METLEAVGAHPWTQRVKLFFFPQLPMSGKMVPEDMRFEHEFSFLLPWEKLEWLTEEWAEANHHRLMREAITWVVFYLISTRLLVWFMKDRKPFDLRIPLILHNAGLALFSIVAMVRGVAPLYHVLTNYGFYATICMGPPKNHPGMVWAYLYGWSKVIEFADTYFLALRKKQIIPLHWIHHAIVVLVAAHCVSSGSTIAGWFAFVNVCVHAFMYSYFTLQACKIKVPNWAAQSITFVQTVQMFWGLFVICSSIYYKEFTSRKCYVNYDTIFFATGMYTLFALMFIRFYRKKYLEAKRLREANRAAATSSDAIDKKTN